MHDDSDARTMNVLVITEDQQELFCFTRYPMLSVMELKDTSILNIVQ